MRAYLVLCLLLVNISFTGCKHRGGDAATALASGGQAEYGDSQHHKENFDRSMELINSLDDSPSLQNTPGFERLVSIADRLDKWIRNQKPDDMWNSDTPFKDIENVALNAAETAKKVVRSLALLQGETVWDDEGRLLTASETLQEERQTIIAGFDQFVTQLQTLATLADLPTMNRFSQSVSHLREQFAALDGIAHLSVDDIRAFAKGLYIPRRRLH